ncbi:MAG: hypothetical protein R6T90_07450 [Dissulfuribacterales bacterium]
MIRLDPVAQIPPKIRVINKSGLNLERLMLEGTNSKTELGTIPARASQSIIVHPGGESSV